jgi:V/A-type H+-transporting ATPase subunit C
MAFGTSNVIITKSKAIYSTTLREKALFLLSEKRTLAEFVNGLKTLPQFADIFVGVSEQVIRRSQLEDLLRKVSYKQILKIIKYASGKEKDFYYEKLMDLEINYILSLFRYFISQDTEKIKPIDEIPSFVQRHSTLPFSLMANVPDVDTFMKLLLTTKYREVVIPFLQDKVENFRYTNMEQGFYVFQYRHIFDQIERFFSGKEKQNLQMMYKTKLDLENLSKIYRLKKFYQADQSTIESVLFLEYSNVKKSFWKELIAIENPEDVLNHFNLSSFSTIKDKNDYVFIEFDIDKIKYHLAKRFLYYSTSAAEVFSAFSILEEIEQINLTNIIEGIRYNIEPAKIQRMLIY